ncbi:hypothetical protein H0G86_003256 [Trichoderma simmonsii]|uniref:Uncharacterized protein n=1 Tax=Trichoderma simmonsii TaxID=1491479 RepID=A0A8G0L556_9HYPO|nr:hypothetical protein H0G86_003256 [Trichoderma simmonsii]
MVVRPASDTGCDTAHDTTYDAEMPGCEPIKNDESCLGILICKSFCSGRHQSETSTPAVQHLAECSRTQLARSTIDGALSLIHLPLPGRRKLKTAACDVMRRLGCRYY